MEKNTLLTALGKRLFFYRKIFKFFKYYFLGWLLWPSWTITIFLLRYLYFGDKIVIFNIIFHLRICSKFTQDTKTVYLISNFIMIEKF